MWKINEQMRRTRAAQQHKSSPVARAHLGGFAYFVGSVKKQSKGSPRPAKDSHRRDNEASQIKKMK